MGMGTPVIDPLVEKLLALAARRGISRRELARQIRVSHSTLVRLSQGGDTHVSLIRAIADVLGVDLVSVARKKRSKIEK